MSRTFVSALLAAVGFILIAGAAGTSDFYEECRAAADCVAGEEPSFVVQMIQAVIGLTLMAIGVKRLAQDEEIKS